MAVDVWLWSCCENQNKISCSNNHFFWKEKNKFTFFHFKLFTSNFVGLKKKASLILVKIDFCKWYLEHSRKSFTKKSFTNLITHKVGRLWNETTKLIEPSKLIPFFVQRRKSVRGGGIQRPVAFCRLTERFSHYCDCEHRVYI